VKRFFPKNPCKTLREHRGTERRRTNWDFSQIGTYLFRRREDGRALAAIENRIESSAEIICIVEVAICPTSPPREARALLAHEAACPRVIRFGIAMQCPRLDKQDGFPSPAPDGNRSVRLLTSFSIAVPITKLRATKYRHHKEHEPAADDQLVAQRTPPVESIHFAIAKAASQQPRPDAGSTPAHAFSAVPSLTASALFCHESMTSESLALSQATNALHRATTSIARAVPETLRPIAWIADFSIGPPASAKNTQNPPQISPATMYPSRELSSILLAP